MRSTPLLLCLSPVLSCASPELQDSALAATAASVQTAPSHSSTACDLSRAPVTRDGQRRLALLVGVSRYENPNIPRLDSTRADVRTMADLLTAPGGYDFPVENVCVLEDQAATLAGVREAFRRHLLERARPGDVVVFYFSGHGTQVEDMNGDEVDGNDEALIPYDGFTSQVSGLRDDLLNTMLGELLKKTSNVTVILDACTSAGATKGLDRNVMKAYFMPPGGRRYDDEPAAPSGDAWTPAELGGLVLASAARDSTAALASQDGSVSRFTAALATALSDREAGVATWTQAQRRAEALVSASTGGAQLPVFQGELDRPIFGLSQADRPLAWAVTEAGVGLDLAGIPLPGWGPGATLRLYPGSASRADAADPAKAIGAARLDTRSGTRAKATLLGAPARPIQAGDLAVLMRPAPETRKLSVAVDPALSAAARTAVSAGLARDPYGAPFVQLGADGADFMLRRSKTGTLELVDPQGVVRNLLGPADAPDVPRVVSALVLHAQQRALLQLRGEGSQDFQNDQTLLVEMVPYPEQSACVYGGWVQACPNQDQIVPLCARWRIRVTNTHPTATLVVGGVVMSSDGAIWGLPSENERVEIPPRDSVILDPSRPFEALPPTEAPEHVIIVGRRASEPHIDWSSLTQQLARKGGGDPLADSLGELLGGRGLKGTGHVAAATTAWTTSHLTYRVTTNPTRYALSADRLSCAASKEYSIQHFDVTPYLPQDPDDALARVLEQADALTTWNGGDGVRYQQHDWSGRDDKENLRRGIDCSHAVWFAYTRAGLPYTPGQRYLSTASMFDAARGSCSTLTPQRSPMHEHFESCLGQPYQTGDLLVWQGVRPGTQSCVGHTVMVVDPEAFIGWGSHGWDGSTDEDGERMNDVGVEYQRIGKRTWERWDRDAYSLKACWRHESMLGGAAEDDPAPLSSFRSLGASEANPCDEAVCEVR